ncbi:hypothetical protein HDV00_006325 [Rhizophlyctis rosea]|nr:hypothetical protein HDV00_006325 [Rhizophlyctis rosea]
MVTAAEAIARDLGREQVGENTLNRSYVDGVLNEFMDGVTPERGSMTEEDYISRVRESRRASVRQFISSMHGGNEWNGKVDPKPYGSLVRTATSAPSGGSPSLKIVSITWNLGDGKGDGEMVSRTVESRSVPPTPTTSSIDTTGLVQTLRDELRTTIKEELATSAKLQSPLSPETIQSIIRHEVRSIMQQELTKVRSIVQEELGNYPDRSASLPQPQAQALDPDTLRSLVRTEVRATVHDEMENFLDRLKSGSDSKDKGAAHAEQFSSLPRVPSFLNTPFWSGSPTPPKTPPATPPTATAGPQIQSQSSQQSLREGARQTPQPQYQQYQHHTQPQQQGWNQPQYQLQYQHHQQQPSGRSTPTSPTYQFPPPQRVDTAKSDVSASSNQQSIPYAHSRQHDGPSPPPSNPPPPTPTSTTSHTYPTSDVSQPQSHYRESHAPNPHYSITHGRSMEEPRQEEETGGAVTGRPRSEKRRKSIGDGVLANFGIQRRKSAGEGVLASFMGRVRGGAGDGRRGEEGI